MAIKKDWIIVWNKDAKKIISKNDILRTRYNIWDSIWFIWEQLRLYEWKVVDVLDNWYYKCEVCNKYIHSNWELQIAIVDESDLRFNKV